MFTKTLKSNIWKFTIYRITDQQVFSTILGVYFLTLPGTTPQTLGMMLLLGSIAGLIAELPSGYVSDKIGHKNALVLAKLGHLSATILYLIGSSVGVFFAAAMIGAIFGSFGTGTTSAFMHVLLKGLGKDKDYAKIMGKITSLVYGVPIALIVLVPFLVDISFKLPFVVALFLNLIGLGVAFTLVSPKGEEEKVKEVSPTNFVDTFKHAYRLGFMKYILFVAFLGGVFISIRDFKDVYQAFLGVPIIYYGVFFGISRGLASLLALSNGFIKKHTTIFSFHILFAGLIASIALTLGFVSSPFVAVLLRIVFHALWPGLMEVRRAYHLEIISPVKNKATLFSLTALILAGVAGIARYVFGVIATHLSFSYAFIIFAIILALFLLPILIRIYRSS